MRGDKEAAERDQRVRTDARFGSVQSQRIYQNTSEQALTDCSSRHQRGEGNLARDADKQEQRRQAEDDRDRVLRLSS